MYLSISLFFIFILLVGLIVKRLQRNLSYWKRHGIPYEKPHFLLGNIVGARTVRPFCEIWMSYYNKFKGTGPFAGFYWFQRKSAFILDQSLAKLILVKDFNKFTNRNFFTNERDDPLSAHLFLLKGAKWRNMRQVLSRTFSSGKIKHMYPTMVKVGHNFLNDFNKFIEKTSEVDVKEVLACFTTDMIATVAFGLECNSLQDSNSEFRVMSRGATTDLNHGILGQFFLNTFPDLASKLRMKQTAKHIEKFFLRIVRETVAERECNNIRRNDFMDLLIDMKNNKIMKSEDSDTLTNLTMKQLTAQAFGFFIAGFETSSTAMGFLLYELAKHPDIQQKVRDEINSVLEDHNQNLTYESLKEMHYLDQCLSESLRLYTVLPVLNRQCLEDYPVPGHPNYVIKKGMPVFIPIGAMHLDPDNYPNPEEFNPDNFLPEVVKKRNNGLWLPFGDGPRNCIGMRFAQLQSRIGLAMLLKDFRFSVCLKTPMPMKFDLKHYFMIPDTSGIHLKVEKV